MTEAAIARSERRLLIVEDDEDIASALARGFGRDGYQPLVAHDLNGALALARSGCEGAIVDVMLGEDRGEDLVRRLRAMGVTAPIIMLSALSGVEDRSNGLAAGADDYVAKPFEFGELAARLKVQERRRAKTPPLDYDPETRRVSAGGRVATLTEREGDLLAFLIANTGRVVSRAEIFDTLWLLEGGSSENVVDVYIGYLRRKLAPMSDFGAGIRTVRGKGFVLGESRHD